jgi:hypothetical protein
MVPAPAHARHGQEEECDTCEDDRRAAAELFTSDPETFGLVRLPARGSMG